MHFCLLLNFLFILSHAPVSSDLGTIWSIRTKSVIYFLIHRKSVILLQGILRIRACSMHTINIILVPWPGLSWMIHALRVRVMVNWFCNVSIHRTETIFIYVFMRRNSIILSKILTIKSSLGCIFPDYQHFPTVCHEIIIICDFMSFIIFQSNHDRSAKSKGFRGWKIYIQYLWKYFHFNKKVCNKVYIMLYCHEHKTCLWYEGLQHFLQILLFSKFDRLTKLWTCPYNKFVTHKSNKKPKIIDTTFS